MARRIRILHVINGLDYGGAELIMTRLAMGLSPLEFEQMAVALFPEHALIPDLEEKGIRCERMNARNAAGALKAAFRIAALIRQWKPDVIQGWMYHGSLVASLARALSFRKSPLLWSIHHTKLGKDSSKTHTRLAHRCLRRLSRRVPWAIQYCAKTAREIHEAEGFDSSKSVLIPNGTDPDRFQPDPEASARLREELGIPLDAPVIGHAARFYPQKDHATLLEAFAMLQAKQPDVYLLACGENVTPDNLALRALVNSCPDPAKVRLAGIRSRMDQVYPAFTIGTLSSCEGEAFPLVLGEAMCCEKPCVATDVGDSGYIIGDTGLIVEARNPARLAAAWERILATEESLANLGRKARERIVLNFTIGEYVARHAAIYRAAVSGGKLPTLG